MHRLKIGIIEIVMLLGLALVFNALSIRICPFFNIFKVPCPGCGLTRSIICLFKGNFLESIQYNILGFPILIFCCIYIILIFINKYDQLELIFVKHKKKIIAGSIILLIITELINLKNPKLY